MITGDTLAAEQGIHRLTIARYVQRRGLRASRRGGYTPEEADVIRAAHRAHRALVSTVDLARSAGLDGKRGHDPAAAAYRAQIATRDARVTAAALRMRLGLSGQQILNRARTSASRSPRSRLPTAHGHVVSGSNG